MFRIGILAACAAAFIAAAATGPARPGSSAERGAGIADAAFLAGAWKGVMGEERVEEHWSAPDGGNIIGMFRWMKADGTARVLEMLTISEEEGAVVLRLRHFDTKLTPWASEATPPTLRLAEASEGRAVFRGEGQPISAVTYHGPTPDELRILVEFPGDRPALDFRLSRAAAGAK